MRILPLSAILSLMFLSVGCGGKPDAPQPIPMSADSNAEPAGSHDAQANADSEPDQTDSNTSTTESKIADSNTSAQAIRDESEFTKRVRKIYEEIRPNTFAASSLFEIGIAMHNFHDTFSHFPSPNSLGEKTSPQGLSWRVHLLPFLEQGELYEKFHLDEPWDSEHNKSLVAKMPKVFGDDPNGKTRLHVFTGKGSMFPSGTGAKMRDVIDGTSNTLMVVVAGADKADIWTRPGGLEFDKDDPQKSLGNVGEAFFAVMADGGIKEIKTNAPYLASLVQKDDGEALPTGFHEHDEEGSILAANPGAEIPIAPRNEKFDLSYVPAECSAIAVVQHRKILSDERFRMVFERMNWTDKTMSNFIYEDLLEGGYKLPRQLRPFASLQFGLTLQDVDELRMIMLPKSSMPQPELPRKELSGTADVLTNGEGEIIAGEEMEFEETFSEEAIRFHAYHVRTAFPLSLENLLQQLTRHAGTVELREYHGVPVLFPSEGEAAFAILNENEFIAGRKVAVKKMVEAGKAPQPTGPLQTLLSQQRESMIQVASVSGEDISRLFLPMTNMFLVPLKTAIPTSAKMDTLHFAIDLREPDLFSLQATCDSPETATQLSNTVTKQLSATKTTLRGIITRLKLGQLETYANIFEDFFNGLTSNANGSKLSMTVKIPDQVNQLMALVGPAMDRAKQAAANAQRRNNLRQFAIASHNYHDIYGRLLAPNIISPEVTAKTGLSWRVHILPFLDYYNLYEQFKLDEPWDSPHNKKLIPLMPPIFGKNKDHKTRIHLIVGGGSPFLDTKAPRIQDIKDGMSNTLMFVEAGDRTAEIWTKPGGLKFDPKDPFKCLGTLPDGEKGFNFVRIDGSVGVIPKSMKPSELRSLVDHNDGK